MGISGQVKPIKRKDAQSVRLDLKCVCVNIFLKQKTGGKNMLAKINGRGETVLLARIVELSELKTRNAKIKEMVQHWRGIIFVAIAALTLKVAAEQIVLALRN